MPKRRVKEIRRLIQTPASPDSADPSQRGAAPVVTQDAHMVYHYLHLSRQLTTAEQTAVPRLRVTPEEIEAARSHFDVSEKVVWVGLNAGAEYGPAKRWPAERFGAVAKILHEQTHCGILIFGGPGDSDISDRLMAELGSSIPVLRNASGRTTLRELMALLACCRVLVTNDTGPMHLAAALGVKVVAPFGSTSPELTGPGRLGSSDHRLIQSDAACSPCFLRTCPIDFRCMRDITVERVAEAALERLVTAA